ncbi:MAG: DUF1540 domain-containing protein [Eubacteriales bacterium]
MKEKNRQEHRQGREVSNVGIQKCISCDVKNCYYHDSSNYCTAEQINVGPGSAETSAETLCTTFRPKSE